jgi:hypothetical protein
MARLQACQRRPPRDQAVGEFIILPDFHVANAARLGECPPAENGPQKMKDFP